MKRITPRMKENAKNYYKNNDFESFIKLFFSKVYIDKDGIECEIWTNGGVHMIPYFHAKDGSYFFQFKDYAVQFDIDEEIDFHRQEERYCDAFKIKESVADFEAYQNFLMKISSLIN